MDQKQLLDVAKQQQGLTSDYSLAQRLGVSTGRISELRSGKRMPDEAEIMMLADMAGIEPHKAFAAVHKDKEKNPAKRAYWEKISIGFAMAGFVGALVLTGFSVTPNAEASGLPLYKLCEFVGAVYLFYGIAFLLPENNNSRPTTIKKMCQ